MEMLLQQKGSSQTALQREGSSHGVTMPIVKAMEETKNMLLY